MTEQPKKPHGSLISRRCGAKNRRGLACSRWAMRNGRCANHGGLSTGPKTRAGIESIRRARTIHGRYSAAAKAERIFYRTLLAEANTTLRAIQKARPGAYQANQKEKDN
jgi:hypothetical protein